MAVSDAMTTNDPMADLSPDRRALVEALSAQAAGKSTGIPRADRDGVLAASYAQQRLWFIDRLEPGNPAYNCPIALRLRGPLDVAALEASLNDIVRRHEVLRTTFDLEDGAVIQVISPYRPVALPVTDLGATDAAGHDALVEKAIVADAHRAFDLVRGPVMRAELLRFSADEHVFLYDIHHIANDGWSVGVFYAELAEGYNARIAGRPAHLPELTIQYADYAVWQRSRVARLLDDQLAYWSGQLSGLTPLDLPTDRPRPSVLSPYGGFAHFDLTPDLVSGLQSLGQAEGASPFMTLLAVLDVLLMRYTGQEDVSVATAATDRDRTELQNLIGFFPNTLVLRADLTGEPSFRTVVRRVRDAARAGFSRADLPFDLLVQHLAPQRDASRNPLFSVFLSVDETPETLPSFSGLTVDAIVPDFLTAKFDLGFIFRIESEQPKVHCVYSTDLFDADTIDALLGHFRTLALGLLAEPDAPVTEVALLDAAEQQMIIRDWNDTAEEFPADSCLHELFEARVAAAPDDVAVICAGRSLTYSELDRLANGVARRLIAGGVALDSIVGIQLNRSPELVAAILGVLKAGAAYLPLDPEYPPERVSFMADDARAWGIIDKFDFEPAYMRPETGVTPEHLAYVIYTSGSTGAPKGIALRHRGAVNNLTDYNRRFSVGPGDVLLGVSSPSFDMSVYDTLGTLAAGGTLVLPGPDAVRDPAEWSRLLVEHAVTIWHSAPALLELILDHPDHYPALRLAMLGGDWIPVSMPERLRAVAPGCRFISLGGATESSVDSTIFEVTETDATWTSIPYGRPLANQRTYILDPHGQPVPVGVPGELHLAGTGLARGYLHRPELTAERFIDHPFGRLYRTGDRARWRRDGVIELLGRMDFQVKIHGLRVEPGEIEALLRKHTGVAEAVVVARGDRGQHTLAAFYVPAGDPVDQEDLREWLAEHVPSYMVPAAFVALPELPTTPNGKVNRHELAERPPGHDSGGELPRDDLEARIAQAWRAGLGLGELGIDDNFFDLGGDSFAAIRVVQAIDRRLPVVELFKNPTVRGLAGVVRTAGSRGETLLHRLTGAEATDVTMVCVPYGGGNVIAYQPLADEVPDGVALWAVALPGHDPSTQDDPFWSIEEGARRCADAVVEQIQGPIIVYGQCAGVALSVRLAQLIEEAGCDVRAVYVGAALPDPDPESSLRRDADTTDEMVHAFLSSMGGFDGALAWSDVQPIIRAVRADLLNASRFFATSYAEPPRRLRAPLRCVFGDADPATEDFASRYTEWALFAEALTLHVIPGGDHYFVRNRARELAQVIRAWDA